MYKNLSEYVPIINSIILILLIIKLYTRKEYFTRLNAGNDIVLLDSNGNIKRIPLNHIYDSIKQYTDNKSITVTEELKTYCNTENKNTEDLVDNTKKVLGDRIKNIEDYLENKLFEVVLPNSTCKKSGFDILSSDQCKKHAQSLDKTWDGEHTDDSRPPGCIFHAHSNHKVYFNKTKKDNAHSHMWSYCKSNF
jgi:hypothetical protein